MAKDKRIHMPGAFGGLMRYDDEFKSKFMISPAIVVGFIVAIILFVLILLIFFPLNLGTPSTGFGGFVIPLYNGLLGF